MKKENCDKLLVTSITFTGDLCFSKYFNKEYKKVEDIVHNDVLNFLKESERCVGNIEGPILNRIQNINKKEFVHYSEGTKARIIDEMNINIWNLANNHVLDCGIQGLDSTIKYVSEYNCEVIGAASDRQEIKPLIIRTSGNIGIISITGDEIINCINWSDYETVKRLILEVKNSCRWCVLVVHAGEEFAGLPIPDTRKRYHKFLELGVDIIVGHHPHVIQPYEKVGDKIIFYSLGNFIFDTDYQRLQLNTDKGLLLKIHFTAEAYSWQVQGICVNRDTNRIKTCEVPVIFRNIGSKEYEMLWPYAARGLLKAERHCRVYKKPRFFKLFPRVKMILVDIYLCKRKRNRILIKGVLSSYFVKRGKRQQKLEEVIKYLLQ